MNASSGNVIQCGELLVKRTNRVESISNGQSAAKNTSSGQFEIYEVMGSGGLYLEVAYAVWENGDQDVRAIMVNKAGPLRRLEPSRLRLGIHSSSENKSWVELSQARVNSDSPNRWPNSKMATYEQLDNGAGISVADKLKEVGALRIGSKEVLLGQTGSRKNYLCVTFEDANRWCPVIAFVANRVLPILNEYTGE